MLNRKFWLGVAGRPGLVMAGLLTFLLVSAWAGPITEPAQAHPADEWVNRYSQVEIGPEGIGIDYLVVMPAQPNDIEKLGLIYTNPTQAVSPEKLQAYRESKFEELHKGLRLLINGQSTRLDLVSGNLTLPQVESLWQQTLHFDLHLKTNSLSPGAINLDYQDTNFSSNNGWREVLVCHAVGIAVRTSNAPCRDQSHRLQSYPLGLVVLPSAKTTAQVSFNLDPTIGLAERPVYTPQAQSNSTGLDPLTILLNSSVAGWDVLLVALAIAFGLGALHALSPGHGKTIVGAYLVGSRGTPRQALLLGLVVTIAHTLGVFLLGVLTLVASAWLLPQKVVPWLELLSGLSVLVIGLFLLRSRWQIANATLAYARLSRPVEAHSHTHSHSKYEPTHTHSSSSMLKHRTTPYDHAQPLQPQEIPFVHQHWSGAGGTSHSHVPLLPANPNQKTQSVSRSLVLLGISAGLAPCPSALVLMLSAIALNRIALGLGLLIVFSLGLASTLTLTGVLFLYGQKLVIKRRFATGWLTVGSVLGAGVIILAGFIVMYTALIQLGLVRI